MRRKLRRRRRVEVHRGGVGVRVADVSIPAALMRRAPVVREAAKVGSWRRVFLAVRAFLENADICEHRACPEGAAIKTGKKRGRIVRKFSQ